MIFVDVLGKVVDVWDRFDCIVRVEVAEFTVLVFEEKMGFFGGSAHDDEEIGVFGKTDYTVEIGLLGLVEANSDHE